MLKSPILQQDSQVVKHTVQRNVEAIRKIIMWREDIDFYNNSYQASSVRVYGVGRVGKLRAVFVVLRKFLVVVEPAVLRCREALVLQTS